MVRSFSPHRLCGQVLLLILLCGCAPSAPKLVRYPVDLTLFRPFNTPAPLLPFRSRGAVRLRYGKEQAAGRFVLLVGREQDMHLQVLAPLTGALLLEVRWNHSRLLLAHHVDVTYFAGDNTGHNRMALLGLDLTPEEFLLLLTARVPREWFFRKGGRRIAPHEVRMGDDEEAYHFTLKQGGLPSGWRKTYQGAQVFRVEYREYMTIGADASLRLPRKIRVYDQQEQPLLVLGIQEFQPGLARNQPLNFNPPSGAHWRPVSRPR